jgi:YgiT-type zinc finger domain-containing protein
MNCLICRQAEIVDELTSVMFERGEMRLVVNNVPARVCPSCGEAYVDEEVAVRLLQDADGVSKAGTLEDVIEYNEHHPK